MVIKSPRKVLGISATFLVVMSFAFWHWMESGISRRWQAMEDRLAVFRKAKESRGTFRPPLRGKLQPGNAWDYYLSAVALPLDDNDVMLRMDPYLESLGEKRNPHSPNLDVPAVRALVQTHEAALRAFHHGPGRAPGERPSDDVLYPPDWLAHKAYRAAKLALCRARLLFEAGQVREALEVALDVAQFARDLGDNTDLRGQANSARCFWDVFRQVHDFVTLGKAAPAVWSQLERELEILEQCFPKHSDAIANQALADGEGWRIRLPEISDPDLAIFRPIKRWEMRRYLFSSRVLAADAFEFVGGWAERYQGCDAIPYLRERELQDLDYQQRQASNNPVVREYDSLNRSMMRYPLAQLRILRVVARYKASGEIRVLPDPFGECLRHSLTGTHLKVWSAGYDGSDDEGKGGWDLYFALARNSEDITIEVER